MKRLIVASLLLSTALTTASIASAQDRTLDVLSQPSTESSAPSPSYEAPAPASAPVASAPKAAPVGTTTYTPASALNAPAAPVTPPVAAAPATNEAATPAPAESDNDIAFAPSTTAPVPASTAPSIADGYTSPIVPPAGGGATASSLNTVLAQAYATSPALRAEREVLRQQYENVIQAESFKRPTVAASLGATLNRAETDPGDKDTFTSTDGAITATQYLYRGGRTLAEVERQLRLSKAAEATYDSVTQTTIMNVVSAAMDIQRDRATIGLTKKNREVIAKQLESAKNGFEVGELTRTDVSQAQARLSGADADLVVAESALASSLARFQQYAGIDGANLELPLDTPALSLPASVEEAQGIALKQNPNIHAAQLTEQASQSAIKTAEGGLLPTVSLNGELSKAYNPTALLDESNGATLGVRATMPLYEAGATRSSIRQAKINQFEKRSRLEDTTRAVSRDVTTAWSDLQSAKAAIDAYNKQVEAATLARDGVYKEREVGTRTILDTLNADAELLDAQVGLVRARHDAVVASYSLTAAMGGLTGPQLGFIADAKQAGYLETARGNTFGTEVGALQ